MTAESVNVRGGSRQLERGSYCTPKWFADAVGPWDLDPFSNPRSHIIAAATCELERGDDGLLDKVEPGAYRSRGGLGIASPRARVWIQPPYSIVLRAFNHYAHTRWCCLLRFDPRTEWFDAIYSAAELIAVPRGTFNFEPPPGVKAGGGNSFPHAAYYRRAEDATPAVLRACVAWRKKSLA